MKAERAPPLVMWPSTISVIIPALNEESVILGTLARLEEYLSRHCRGYELIVVDDGSTDRCAALIREWGQGKAAVKLLVNERNRGKGFSVKRGMLEATGDILVFSDADLSTPIEELEHCVPLLAAGAHIVIGSRALPDSRLLKQQGVIRRGMGKVFNWIIQTVLFSGIPDTQCGFKCFTAPAAREVFSAQRLEGFSFDAEILFIARKRGLVIRDVPVRWMNRADSRVRLVSDACRMLYDLFRIRANDWQGRYDLPH